jgi:Zinc carboxypeptidase/Immune inhibitor A peptidase M6
MTLRGACAAMVALATLAFAGTASAAPGLNAYKVNAGAKQLQELKRQGFDINEGYLRGGIEIVATRGQIAKLRRTGVRARLLRDRRGRTANRAAAAQAADGWQVWRPYARTDVPVSGSAGNPTDNIKTQLEKLAQRYDRITELITIGRSVNGLPIYAMRVTKNADRTPDGRRPAVLYSSLQHAREWLAGETGRRTLRLFVDNYGRRGPAVGTDGQPVEGVSADEVTRLVNRNELWFILVANPDGYDYTFTPANRLWRKNLRDNDGDGQISAIDGVDLNRNFPTRWRYDNEGSSSEQSSETYRGSGPASEPETRAFNRLVNRVHFTSNKNDHTHGLLLLWPPGWQVDTHFADEPIFEALAGDDDNPAIPGFDPDVGSDLYTTNGDTNDHLYQVDKVQSFTPEGTSAASGSGFVFQDVEADVQAEFERHVQFALDLARSASDPDNPVSHLGNEAPDFEVDAFEVSYGDPQTVQVNARRDLGRITLKYRINGGRVRSASTREWRGGERYGDEGDYWYHMMRGTVRGTDPGDEVEVWFVAENPSRGDDDDDDDDDDKRGRGGRGRDDVVSRSFTYDQRSDSGARVLVLAQEDYTGNSAFPPYPGPAGPFYLSYYTAALNANGVRHDVYNLDAEGRRAPHALGVLSHFDAVMWYTGNDNVTRAAPQPGVAGEEAHDTTMAVRDFVNEGGTVALSGVHAGRQYDLVEYPQDGRPLNTCDGNLQTTDGGVCAPLSNDFLQYYLGSYVRADAGGLKDEGGVYPVQGVADPFDFPLYQMNGPDSAGNQEGAPVFIGTGTHLVTSSILDPAIFPQFASEQAADWVIPGDKPFDPHTGSWYMNSQNIDRGYKRLTRTIDMRDQTAGELSFFTSFDVEQDWDFVFVEAQSLNADGSGAGDFTTLPDGMGHTQSTNTGASCDAGWTEELHNRLRDYMDYNPAGGGSCTPKPGKWHAATGGSGGWQEWKIDLSRYAGKQVEISIVYATDWGTLNVPGMLVDDTKVTVGGSVVAETSFETDLGGWTVPGAHPVGPASNLNDWIRSQRIFEDAAVTKTAEGLVFGFGFEGVDGAEARRDLMARTLEHLLE